MHQLTVHQQSDEVLKVCTNIIGARDEYTQGTPTMFMWL